MKRNLLIITISTFFSLFLIETFLRIYPQIIDDRLILNFPPTKIKKKLSKKKNLFVTKENSIYIEGSNKKLYVFPKKPIFYPPSGIDAQYGATNIFFAKNGFCNRYPIKDSYPSIMSFGDSFTFCSNLLPEQTFSKLIKMPGKNYQNLNYGFGGLGPYDYLEIMKEKINNNTKLIVVGIYEGNDLLNSLLNIEFNKKSTKEKLNIKLDKLIRDQYFMDDINPNDELYKRLIKKTFLKLYISNLFYAIFIKCHTKESCTQKFDKKNQINFKYYRNYENELQIFNTENADLGEVKLAEKIYKKEISENEIYNAWEPALKKMKSLSNSYNSKIIFIYIPSAYSAFGEKINFYDQNVKKIVFNFSDTERKVFKKICNKNNLECIDTTNHLIKYNEKNIKPSHFPSNVHLSPEGHAEIANFINLYIEKKFKNNETKNNECKLKEEYIPTVKDNIQGIVGDKIDIEGVKLRPEGCAWNSEKGWHRP